MGNISDSDRYKKAAHGMQSGVKGAMDAGLNVGADPKHLRVGVNSALVNCKALADLLIAKGIITLEEYTKANADAMEEEKKSYEVMLSEHYKADIKLG